MDPELVRLSKALKGFAVNQIVASAVRLEIPSLVQESDKSKHELVDATGIPWERLAPVMAVLVDLGIVERADTTGFTKTSATRFLTRETGSLYGQALLSADMYYKVWANLDHSLRTGDSGFIDLFGVSMWNYLAEHEAESQHFSRTMSASSQEVAEDVIESYPFPTEGKVVDIGAGDGSFLVSLLERRPSQTGVGLELPTQAGRLQDTVDAHELRERCSVVIGDMFTDVPGDGDLYMFKGVLHNWDDGHLEPMLKKLHSTLKPGAKVLIVERSISQTEEMNMYGAINTLTMTLLFGSSDRTVDGYRSLLTRCGFNTISFRAGRSGLDLIEGIKQ